MVKVIIIHSWSNCTQMTEFLVQFLAGDGIKKLNSLMWNIILLCEDDGRNEMTFIFIMS